MLLVLESQPTPFENTLFHDKPPSVVWKVTFHFVLNLKIDTQALTKFSACHLLYLSCYAHLSPREGSAAIIILACQVRLTYPDAIIEYRRKHTFIKKKLHTFILKALSVYLMVNRCELFGAPMPRELVNIMNLAVFKRA